MNRKTRRMLGAASLLPLSALAAAQTKTAPTEAAPPWAPAAFPTGTWTFHHEQVLGTSLQLNVRASDRATAVAAEAAVLAVFDREAGILSAWLPESEFSRWSRTRLVPVPVSGELLSTLAAFDLWRGRTDGALDPSVEAATRLWTSATAAGRTPSSLEIDRTVEAMAQPHWALDPATSTATRLSDVPLALASFVKSRIASKAADAALQAGANGILLNVGGDIVARGAITQVVAIADPRAAAENDLPLDHVLVNNASVATSGSYRRGFDIATVAARSPAFSHLIDPRTARPVGHILSSTVIARDAETAGALATAFSVLPTEQSRALAARSPGVDYLIVTADGETLTSPGWSRYQLPGLRASSFQAGGFQAGHVQSAALHLPPAPTAGLWDPSFELAIELNLPRIGDARYRRPYVAVWVEDADHFPVRTLSLWTQNPRWLPELKQWYRDDQIRNLSEGTDISRTIGSATRPPGKYNLKWDGKDNEGKPVKAGAYTIVIEASREHGGYQIERRSLNFNAHPEQATLASGKELGSIVLDYRKR